MMMACGALALFGSGAMAEAPKLASVFTDHMVIQRDAPVRLFGTADPGAEFMVSLDAASTPVRAGRDGRWWVEFPELSAGGPHKVSVTVEGEAVQAIGDVLAGDVFLCSGQSNMEYPLSRVTYAEREVAAADHSNIRLLQVDKGLSLAPNADFPGGSAWAVASPETAAGFSAVCYYAGRALSEAYDVPVGLINSSWGGSRIEPWIDGKIIGAMPDHAEQVALLETYRADRGAAAKIYSESWQQSWRDDPATEGTVPWEDTDAGEWKPVPGTLRDWREWGDPDLTDHLGMVWHKVSFDLTPQQAEQSATIHIGAVDDTDMTWLNGTAIGTTFHWGGLRAYEVSSDLLKPGKNTVLVNAHNDYGDGGMNGPDSELRVEWEDGSSLSLAEGWAYRKVDSAVGAPKPAPWFTIKGYTMLHNAMIAPLAGIRLKGAIWYQGESNAGDGVAYESLLDLLVRDWRAKFGADLPVTVVQLPRYGALPTEAGKPGWGVIRESMRRVAAKDDRVGLAVTIDMGDPVDIHPPNKLAVAERVVRVMKSLVYGEADAAASGPVASRATLEDGVVHIAFDGVEQGLETVSAGNVIGVELCDAGMCRFASAALDGASVVVRTGNAPVSEIRYCQGDAPLCNLFDGNGLPAGPFWIAVE
jgi:sialate O-acetylesterase